MKQIEALPHVQVEGMKLPEALQLTEVRVTQRLDAPAQCELSWRLGGLDHGILESIPLDPGATLSLVIEGQSRTLFTGEVTSVEHAHDPAGGFSLRARAYDDLIRLQRHQSLNTHVEVTTAELARTLAGEAGLSATARVNGPLWPRIMPRFDHDLALLRHYCQRSGLHFIFQDGGLHLFPPDHAEDTPLELVLGDRLFEARIERNRAQPVGSVHVFGWDPHTGETRRVRAGGGSSVERALLGQTAESDDEAEALAGASQNRYQAKSHVFWGVASGNTSLAPGCRIHPRGLAADQGGPYRLTTVVHSIAPASGYICELDTRPEPWQTDTTSRVPGLVLGDVCDVDDPADCGRVQVTLHSYNEALSPWLLVLQSGAGTKKGLVALPEVGDQVLVGLPDGDPSRGIVLGGVYASEGPPRDPESARSNSAHRPYTLTTRGGQRIELNDADGSIRFGNADGSYLAMTPDGITLHALGNLTLEAPGHRLTLGSNEIDMEQR
ncbi:phage baseplate assembly protein V [Halomonadaceae bacterium KBTZ08]